MAATWKEIALKEEVASLSSQDAHDIGTEASAGVSTDASKHDHVHKLGSGTVDNSTIALDGSNKLIVKGDGIGANQIADDAVGSEHIKTLDSALDFNGQQAQDMVLHQSTIGSPPTAAVGVTFQDSSTKKWYICTAV